MRTTASTGRRRSRRGRSRAARRAVRCGSTCRPSRSPWSSCASDRRQPLHRCLRSDRAAATAAGRLDMSTTEIVIIVIAVLVVIGVAVMLMRKREGERLKERFGPEYDRQVEEAGSETKAQAELLKREKRVDKLDIRPLAPEQREAFAADWQQVQARFVDDPERSL